MDNSKIVYILYVFLLSLLVGAIILTPFLAFDRDVSVIYKIFEPTCHQKISRSLCVLKDLSTENRNRYWIGDCTNQTGEFVESSGDRKEISVRYDSVIGYKMPVCARDVGIYGAMLLGALVYPFVRKIGSSEVYPAIYLIIALIPLGLDGTIQLVSEFGILPFVYESSNLVRLVTGAIAGFAASFYAIAILVNIFRGRK